MNDHESNPLDEDLPTSSIQATNNDDAVFAAYDEEPEAPPRPLLKPSLYLLAVGFAIAFIFGVLATNSGPNTTGEMLGSWLNRVGIFIMLAAFCGILFAYRYTYLLGLYQQTREKNFATSEWTLLTPVMLAVLGFHWLLLLAFQSAFGNFVLLVSLAIIIIHASLMVTMVYYSNGIWKGFCIGFVASIAITLMGGGFPYILSSLTTGLTFRRATPVATWPGIALHAFFVLNGFISAIYVWSHQKMQRLSESRQDTPDRPEE